MCSDFTALPHCPFKERFPIDLFGNCQKRTFIFLNKPCLNFISYAERVLVYVLSMSFFHSYQCFVFGKEKKKILFI